jgi:recombinational DNA repair protein RecR
MIYSPQFSELASVSVRRLAWALGVSMPAAVNLMVKLMPSIVDPSKVCQPCKDKTKCQCCIFTKQFPRQEQEIKSHFTPKEQNALEAVCDKKSLDIAD